MKGKSEWRGNIAELWEKLKFYAGNQYSDNTFPKKPRTLRKGLEVLRVNLMKVDIIFEFGTRTWVFWPIPR